MARRHLRSVSRAPAAARHSCERGQSSSRGCLRRAGTFAGGPARRREPQNAPRRAAASGRPAGRLCERGCERGGARETWSLQPTAARGPPSGLGRRQRRRGGATSAGGVQARPAEWPAAAGRACFKVSFVDAPHRVIGWRRALVLPGAPSPRPHIHTGAPSECDLVDFATVLSFRVGALAFVSCLPTVVHSLRQRSFCSALRNLVPGSPPPTYTQDPFLQPPSPRNHAGATSSTDHQSPRPAPLLCRPHSLAPRSLTRRQLDTPPSLHHVQRIWDLLFIVHIQHHPVTPLSRPLIQQPL